MKAKRLKLFVVIATVGLLGWASSGAVAQDPFDEDYGAVPQIPSMEEVQAGQATIANFIPTNYSFQIGIVGDYEIELDTATGPQKTIKTPLILINPSTGKIGVYAKNFPARVVAQARNGEWIVGIAPSQAVEGSSGSRFRECAVSLNLSQGGVVKLVKEFPLYSNFQAFFDTKDKNLIYYCINEPAAVNKITKYNLKTEESKTIRAEGNRFYLYGLKESPKQSIWVADPLSTKAFPVAKLLDLKTGEPIDSASFPGATELIANHQGDALLAVVRNGAEASIGWFDNETREHYQIKGLVLTRPSFKWLYNSKAVIAKESTVTKDRFLRIDLKTGQVTELYNAMFKIGLWDISPEDDALVFIPDSVHSPTLFVVPLTDANNAINQIRLRDVQNVSWLGCMTPPASGGGWLKKLLPF